MLLTLFSSCCLNIGICGGKTYFCTQCSFVCGLRHLINWMQMLGLLALVIYISPNSSYPLFHHGTICLTEFFICVVVCARHVEGKKLDITVWNLSTFHAYVSYQVRSLNMLWFISSATNVELLGYASGFPGTSSHGFHNRYEWLKLTQAENWLVFEWHYYGLFSANRDTVLSMPQIFAK